MPKDCRKPETPQVTNDEMTVSNRDKPNVLVIMTDQHRWDLMTCAGNDIVPTPGIDRIAARGVRFPNAYCPYPVCVGSRMSLLTGLYPHHTGAITNEDRLDWRYRTIAHHFAANGYLTGLIGKMHFCDAHNHGFEYYMSINDWLMYLGPKVRHYANEIANHPLNPHFFRTVYDTGAGFPDLEDVWSGPSPWVGQVESFDFSDMASALDEEDHLDSFISREAVRFLRRYQDQPFFLCVSLMKPHTPLFPPRAFASRYPVDEMELPPVGDISTYPAHIQKRIRNIISTDERRRKAHLAGYLGNLAFVDTCIDRVYSALEELGLAENTIVLYTSDHGEMCGDHGLFQKFCLFEPAARVPLIVSWPGHLPEGQVSEALVEYIGIYPTLAELCNLPQPTGTTMQDLPGAVPRLDGQSFVELLRDPSRQGPDAVFSENNLRGDVQQFMVRTPRYKYILNQGALDELYDLQEDPGETVNRISDPSLEQVGEDLRQRLFAWYPGCRPHKE